MLLTDTDSPEKIEKEIMYARGLTEHPQKVNLRLSAEVKMIVNG